MHFSLNKCSKLTSKLLISLRPFIMRALEKTHEQRANYSGALLWILRAVSFRVYCEHLLCVHWKKTREHEQATREHCYEYCVQFLSARVASICNARTGKNSRARANYSGALLWILRAVAFCARAFVKFKSSGTVAKYQAKSRDKLVSKSSCQFIYS